MNPPQPDDVNINDNDNRDNHPSCCPSFSTYSTRPDIADIASCVVALDINNNSDQDQDEDEDEEDEFEFDASGNTNTSPGLTPVYPVFNRDLIEGNPAVQLRKLFFDEDVGELKGVAPETYCLWAPKSSSRCMKSSSTGSTTAVGLAVSKTWRLRNLLRRCKSDGKEGLMMLSGKDKSSTRRGDGSKNAAAAAARRKSYLPYKQDLLGFFGSPQSLRKINIPPF